MDLIRLRLNLIATDIRNETSNEIKYSVRQNRLYETLKKILVGYEE